MGAMLGQQSAQSYPGWAIEPPPPPVVTSAPAPRDNMADADAAMKLTTEEKHLYQHHLNNLNGDGKVVNPDKSVSTVGQMSVEIGGKTYNLPTIWGGKELDPEDAIKAAKKVGLDKFPSYSGEKEAESRYDKLHGFMERDTADYLAKGTER